MAPFGFSTLFFKAVEQDVLGISRTDLVTLPRGADSTLFGGWGIKI